MALDLRIHPETAALVDALRAVPYGGTIAYPDLSAAVGIDVTSAGRSRLSSARRIALRDHGAAFTVEYGVGLRRLAPDEAPDIGAAARRKVKRASNSARKAMVALSEHSNGLSPDAARRMSAEMSAHGLIAQITSDKAMGAIKAEPDRPQPPALVAQAFLSHLRKS